MVVGVSARVELVWNRRDPVLCRVSVCVLLCSSHAHTTRACHGCMCGAQQSPSCADFSVLCVSVSGAVKLDVSYTPRCIPCVPSLQHHIPHSSTPESYTRCVYYSY
eukprot:scpid72198/ scgid7240/ 